MGFRRALGCRYRRPLGTEATLYEAEDENRGDLFPRNPPRGSESPPIPFQSDKRTVLMSAVAVIFHDLVLREVFNSTTEQKTSAKRMSLHKTRIVSERKKDRKWNKTEELELRKPGANARTSGFFHHQQDPAKSGPVVFSLLPLGHKASDGESTTL